MSVSVPRRSLRRVLAIAVVATIGAPLVAQAATGAVVASVPTPSSTQTAAPQPAAVPASTTRAGETGLYTHPVYFPLRQPAWISCAKDNCVIGGRLQHGHWAQDWTGDYQGVNGVWATTHPVYAAGAGQAQVIRNTKSCGPEFEGDNSDGTILAVDHGGGVFSVYEHLEIEVADGEWVTPTTRLGTMNAHGSNECHVAYLHFEIRSGGLRGSYEPFNEMKACLVGKPAILPDDLTPYDPNPADDVPAAPYETWNDITPYYEVDGDRSLLRTPTADARCFPTSFTVPSRPAAPTATATETSITVTTPTAPRGVQRTVISFEKYRADLGRYEDPFFVEMPAKEVASTITDVVAGRTYRIKIAHVDAVGTSPWSRTITIVPASPPDAPKVPRRLTATRTAISFGWYRSEKNGAAPTGYVAQIRQMVRGEWGEWEQVRLGSSNTYYRWLDLKPGRDHQVRVRARSAAGLSPWSKRLSIRTLS